MKYLLGAALVVSLTSVSAVAQDRIVLEPASDWVLNYDDDSCALQRQFGQEGQQAYLEMRQFGHNRPIQMIVGSADFDRRAGEFQLAFEPLSEEPFPVSGLDMRLGAGYEGKLAAIGIESADEQVQSDARAFAEETWILTEEQRELVLRGMDLDIEEDRRELERLYRNDDYEYGARRFNNAFQRSPAYAAYRERVETGVERIFVGKAFDEDFVLETGSLRAPMEAMRTCLDELVSHWGVDVEAHRNLTLDVEPVDYAKWVGEMQERYPRSMLRQGMQGFVNVRLSVSDEGEPTACHVQSPINNEEFDETACNTLMRFAKFNPALDAQGQPVASYFQTSIFYVIGRR